MQDRTLYSIQESRRLLGGISPNMIYQLLRTGRLASVVIGSRRFISADAIADLIERSTTTESPSRGAVRRSKSPRQIRLPLLSPSSVRARIGGSQT
jgi:Helix-turn-helix domain